MASLEVSQASLDVVWSNLGSGLAILLQDSLTGALVSTELVLGACSIHAHPSSRKGLLFLPISHMGHRDAAGLFYCSPLCSTPKPCCVGSTSAKSAVNFWNFMVALTFLLQFTPIYHFTLSPRPKQVPQLTGNVTFYTMDVLFALEAFKYFSNNSVPLNKLKRNLSGCA